MQLLACTCEGPERATRRCAESGVHALTGACPQGAEDPGNLSSDWRIAAEFKPSYDKACAALLGQFVICLWHVCKLTKQRVTCLYHMDVVLGAHCVPAFDCVVERRVLQSTQEELASMYARAIETETTNRRCCYTLCH